MYWVLSRSSYQRVQLGGNYSAPCQCVPFSRSMPIWTIFTLRANFYHILASKFNFRRIQLLNQFMGIKRGNCVPEAPFVLSSYSSTRDCAEHVLISKVGWHKETHLPPFKINTILHRPVQGTEGARAAWPAFWVKARRAFRGQKSSCLV